jgi:formiminotetrahydrofolate cyclodeaminase
MAAMKLPKGNETETAARDEALEAATHRAAEVPLRVAINAAATLELAAEVAETGNVHAATDAGSAGAMAVAAVTAAAMNVRVNARDAKDRSAAEGWLAELIRLEGLARGAEDRLHHALKERAGLEA